MTAITLPEAVERFVAAVNAHDAEALLAAFAPGAVVVDDGTTFATERELRDFVEVHLVAPKIELTPVSFDAERMVASGDGEFPGGPLTFAFDFSTEGGRITRLSIEAV
jgi:ketosteroid isomerase-like protein